MSDWRDIEDQPNIDELHRSLPGGPSKFHDPGLKHVEEHLLEHFKAFARFCNKECVNDPMSGKRFWDLDDMTIFDLMGHNYRPGFHQHYDKVTLYLIDAKIAFKNVEIVAVSETFAYATALEKFSGKASDGNDFDFQFRITSLMRKTAEGWQYVHEHYSFPVDMATGNANFSLSTVVDDALALKK